MLKPHLLILLIIFFFKNKNIFITSKNLKSYASEEENNSTECPENCYEHKCNNVTLKCDSCIDGYYSKKCDKECPTNFCKKCDQDNGKCTECINDLILIDGYCCENYCNKCNENGCTECKSLKKYGKNCVDCPSTCKEVYSERMCAQDDGKCSYCDKGKRGDYCKENCNIGCDLDKNNCQQDDGKCNCKNGYYGDTCDGICDPNCVTCDQIDGSCSKCASKYYIDSEDKKVCNKCPDNCEGDCENFSGNCFKCKTSFYGDKCENECSIFCKNNTCHKETGKCECINHFSEESNCTECIKYFDINTNCTDCIENYDISTTCTSCINYYDEDYNCTICKYHFDEESKCTKCKNKYDLKSKCQNCLNHYDPLTNCTECENHYNISTECESCETHYSIADDCQTCIQNYNISENCETCINNFDINTDCKNCSLGFFGEACDRECYEGCNLTVSNCEQEDGKCESCKRGYFNQYCSEQCYEHCLKDNYTCDPKTGICDKCEDLYYGPRCEYKTNITNCTKVDRNGTCLECNATYFLKDGLCKECSSNCSDRICEDGTGKCNNCANINAYGDFCDLTCSDYCNKNGTEYICERDTGKCHFGCNVSGNFSDEYCRTCQQGYYPDDKGCNKECSDNCDDKLYCSTKDGSCDGCKIGYYGKNCSLVCSDLCKKRQCSQDTGVCSECIDGYYKNNTDCIECPDNCSTCDENANCITCKAGKYGKDKCDKTCSINCEGETCEIDGSCDCESKYYGDNCDYNCEGCSESGCEDDTGNCIDHYCLDSYYDPRRCNKTCSENCEDKKCDIFTGECISCINNNWGINCENTCRPECKDDGRVDCCFVKDTRANGLEIDLSYTNENNLKEGQTEFSFINITLGEFELKILVDFETNSPLLIFDSATPINPIETDYTINIKSVYNSSESQCIKGGSTDSNYEYNGFFLVREIDAKDTLKIKDNVFQNFSFLICQEYRIEKDFDSAGEIHGIVGLGLRNYFTENLFYNNSEKSFPKNILVKNNNNKNHPTLYFGDYPEEIRSSFSKLSTMVIENKNSIVMNKLIEFETKFTGIAYSLRKAYHYQYDKNVKVSNRIETNIVFNNLYKQFFEKIYFGDLYQNGCYLKLLQGSEAEYYCNKRTKSQLESLPKLGLILGDYIYYLSHNFLYKESDEYYTFVIKLNGQGKQRIELGKSFFNEFPSIIYNNGNETLNFFGDIKKLNVPLRDPSNLLNIDSDIFTPGGWVTLIIFITVLIIIFCYLIKYCGEKSNNDEDDDDDIDYEEDSLIDETLE